MSNSANISIYVENPLTYSDNCLVPLEMGGVGQSKFKFVWGLWKLTVELPKDEPFIEMARGLFRELHYE